MKRTITCGELRQSDAGKIVVLNGWIHRKRDHGGIGFLNIRDRYGLTQVVVDDDASADLKAVSASLKMEYCIAVEGKVRLRPDSMINPDMETGHIEVKALRITILSKSAVLPFQIDEKTNANEDLRLKYRYLDLRSKTMQEHLILRSKVTFAVREFLTGRNFLEIETPTFIKSTPEGARDYLVPSRLYPGKFYALPQSPQLYKQILMVGGFDRYFQIARCYRDEDARGDRQPEFTQIDMEMSFVSRDDVLSITEQMFGYVFNKTLNVTLPETFPRITYDEAIDRYGTDKPDLRFDMALQDAAWLADISSFAVFKEAVAAGGAVKALTVKGQAAAYSRKKIEELEAVAKIYKAKGMAWTKVSENGFEGGIAKYLSDTETAIRTKLHAEAGDLVLFVADPKHKIACTALGAVRSKLGKDLQLINPHEFAFAWVIDFPLFEWNEDENKWDPAHHMFSAPQEQYLPTLETNQGAVKGDLYDLVLNGYEVASGSIRIHDPELQKRIFKIVGFNPDDAEKKFGFLTEAFKYGAPPHGGIAPGLDRIVMLMAGETSIKEVIAFPKNTFAVSPMDESPSEVDPAQLHELHLSISAP
ncbi:MAG: aspartate--tRNA ligase [Treponema sp.]